MERFINNSEIPVLQSKNYEQLNYYLEWALKQVLNWASIAITSNKEMNAMTFPKPPEIFAEEDIW